MPVFKSIGEHVCVVLCTCVCIYTWRAEADIGTPQCLCVVYTKHLNASEAVLASQLA